ncbi:MAG: hypothetical protein AAFU55_03975 [Pseudomonadota bacterium]
MLRGDIVGLARFETRRERLAARLPQLSRERLAAHQSLVEQVRASARRNASLLEAFLDGARAAETRLTKAEKSGGALGAYRSDGTRIDAAHQEATTSRRA